MRSLEDSGCGKTCAEALVTCLKNDPDNDAPLNGFLIDGLVELQAMEALPLIREAFAADAVDIFVGGDIEDVEIELGVLEKRRTPPRRIVASSAQPGEACY